MIRIQHISINDEDGRIQIDWLDTEEMKPGGGQFHTIYVTMRGQETDEQVAYWSTELRQDAEELLHAALKMLKPKVE